LSFARNGSQQGRPVAALGRADAPAQQSLIDAELDFCAIQ
jgi:hypothetical protein